MKQKMRNTAPSEKFADLDYFGLINP